VFGFVFRCVVYAMVVAIAFAVARLEWSMLGLDSLSGGAAEAAANIAVWHDRLPIGLILAILVLALAGAVARLLAVFFLWALIGAILTAPFAIAHAAG
jgi:hypothetical protein